MSWGGQEGDGDWYPQPGAAGSPSPPDAEVSAVVLPQNHTHSPDLRVKIHPSAHS